MHVIDSERLASIVDRAAAWTVRIRQRITLRQEIALLIEWSEGLVADFVVIQHEFTEVRAGSVLDHDLPATGGRSRISGSERFPVGGAFGFHDKRTEHAHNRQLTIVAVCMKLTNPFLQVGMDVPFQIHWLVLGSNGISVTRGGRRSRLTHDHR